MNSYLQQVSFAGRQAVSAKNWSQVKACARDILNRDRDSSEGNFLLGLAEKAANRNEQAVRAFSRAISLDEGRYDAAVELAGQYLLSFRYAEATTLIEQYESHLINSPLYLDMAGTIYVNTGQPEKGWPLYQRASELQPDVNSLQANFATCSVYVGKIELARTIYAQLLAKFPDHQRNHYELSRLGRVTDSTHIDQMKAMLLSTNPAPEKNIYAYYALGKELEDLEQWDESFEFYKKAGDAAASIGNYEVGVDVSLIDKVIQVCNEDWLAGAPNEEATYQSSKTPVFVVGLPRSGTTLIERILSSHSKVESVGESYFMQVVLKQESRVKSAESMNPEVIVAAAKKDIRRIASAYMDAIAYKFGDKPYFVEKFPENFLYLGFIAKAFPHCRIVYLNRNPLDSCFAMFKQSFFRYAYRLDDLGPYYVAYDRLRQHWRESLDDRLIEVNYEEMVTDQDAQTRKLLSGLGLDFEGECLKFEHNETASNTASTVQIREKIHTRSLYRWKRYEKHLQALKNYLEFAGINIGEHL